METGLPAFVLEPFSAACLPVSVAAAMREGKHLQRSWCSLAGPCACLSSGPEPQDKAHPSYTLEMEQKCFKVYFANGPSKLWLLVSAMFPSPRPSQPP